MFAQTNIIHHIIRLLGRYLMYWLRYISIYSAHRNSSVQLVALMFNKRLANQRTGKLNTGKRLNTNYDTYFLHCATSIRLDSTLYTGNETAIMIFLIIKHNVDRFNMFLPTPK